MLCRGVVNFISGAGRETMPPIMETGKIDIFAFIGSSKAADALIKNCPNPHKVSKSKKTKKASSVVWLHCCDKRTKLLCIQDSKTILFS